MPTATDISSLITNVPERGNRPMIAGTRVSVGRVVALYKQGANAEEIARRIRHLNLAQVYAALTYYHANQERVEADLAADEAEYSRLAEIHVQQPSSKWVDE